jgi:hypothetical protein
MKGEGETSPLFSMRYKLLIDSTRGPAGSVVDIPEGESETIAILTRNGIIGAPFVERGPEVLKVVAPTEIKRRGRPPKNASDTAN